LKLPITNEAVNSLALLRLLSPQYRLMHVMVQPALETECCFPQACAVPGLRGHGDSQTVVFFPPKTPPRHFHHQKVLCDDANIFICIALKIINTPVNRSSSLHQLWVSTGPKREAPSQHHDRGLCHLGSAETIMVGSNLTILDQIAMSGTTRCALNGHNSIYNNVFF
jgi:hypothetical protein